MENKTLGFLDFYEEKEGFFSGALLLVTSRGIPRDLWYSEMVIGTAVKILYGRSLPQYVGIDCFSLPMIQSVKNKPACILICRNDLLDLRPLIDTPVLLVGRKEIDPSDPETAERAGNTGISLSWHKGFQSDFDCAPRLTFIFESLDPIEVFSRILPYLQERRKKPCGHGQ